MDDSRLVRASVVRGLGGRFRFQQADSGERAWELLLLDPGIAVVLSDLSMPGLDGFELLRRVRASRVARIREVPFAVLSGEADPADRARALELGADRFVVKGAALDELGDWIEGALSARPDREDQPRGDAAASARPPVQGDPVAGWVTATMAASVASGPPWALIRLRAPDATDLPARLRRGVRSADALHQEGPDTAWLLLRGAPSLALRVALRFGLLAAGRGAGTPEAAQGADVPRDAPRVDVCLAAIDTEPAARCVEMIRAAGAHVPGAPGLAVAAVGGRQGAGWRFTMPWAAVRQLVG